MRCVALLLAVLGLLTACDDTPKHPPPNAPLRPTQSEYGLLQFGDLLAVRGAKIVETWPVYG